MPSSTLHSAPAVGLRHRDDAAAGRDQTQHVAERVLLHVLLAADEDELVRLGGRQVLTTSSMSGWPAISTSGFGNV